MNGAKKSTGTIDLRLDVSSIARTRARGSAQKRHERREKSTGTTSLGEDWKIEGPRLIRDPSEPHSKFRDAHHGIMESMNSDP
jgi:hypothetical protein